MCPLEFYHLLAPIVGAIKCGHTMLLPPADTITFLNTTLPLFPYSVRIIGNDVFLTGDYSGREVSLRGAQLLSLNGHHVDELLKVMLAAANGDGDSETAGRWRLADQFLFSRRLYTMLGINGPYQIEFTLRGKRDKIAIDGIAFPELQQASKKSPNPLDASDDVAHYWALDEHTAVLRLDRFADEMDGKRAADYLNDVFSEMIASKKSTLILDVRGNGGGADEIGAELYAHFVDQPFLYYRDLVVNKLNFDFYRYAPGAEPLPADWFEQRDDRKYHLIKHPNWGMLQPKTPFFGGKVIVLENGGSFSTTCEFLAKMKAGKNATLVGEECGGGFSGNTSGPGPLLVLPNSKLQLQIHLLGYYMAVGHEQDPRRGVLPDVDVRYKIDDILTGRDLEMKVAEKLARE